MEQRNHSIDHIDPQWKQGRDYQLVCGLDIPKNKRYLEWDINRIKTNRFVPYRIDSRIPVHQAPGDWGFFLISGEWKLTQFMGHEWWEESNKIGNGTTVGAKRGNEAASGRGGKVSGPIQGRRNVESGHWASLKTPDHQSRAGRNGAASLYSERWMCTVTHKVSTANGLSKYQNNRNIDTSNRVKVI